jgi:L-asparaginase
MKELNMSKKSKSVYVLCTGGTITMQKTDRGYALAAGHLAKAMAQITELSNADMPNYSVHDFEQPVDSANMTPALWQKIAEKIFENYANYDGFVILHGTDTMAYTASALSFMLEDLAKPVILTGSQLPLFETRSDARENLINAMLFASQYRIPEVCIYFNNRLFRGNRSKKMDATSFAAYASPNFPVLGKVGTDIMLRHHLLRHTNAEQLRLQPLAPLAISVLRLFPGMSVSVLKNLLQEPLQALILESYGVGTAPEDHDFLEVIRQATHKGVVIVNCSQCPIAKVKMSRYAAGTSLMNAGVISGGDMTTEAALSKLIYLFSKELSTDEIKLQFKTDLRGELSL